MDKLQDHVGGTNSAHNNARRICQVVLKNAPRNHQLTSPDIQHDIVKGAAAETLIIISRDIGQVIERFVGVKHVTDTTSASLKVAIDQFFSENNLSISSLRVNVAGSSCKCRDSLREKQVAKIIEELNSGVISNGRGLNQDTTLKRPGDTRWRSHYVIDMQLQELNDHFTKTTTELLLLSLLALENELDTYISNMRSSDLFTKLKGINELGEKMVQTQRDQVYSLVYLLITLSLILPVATATVERAFSAMKIIKSDLRN
ncbi:uncharacterized protein LOC126800669 [Argentina anserina]|uniref:uncharacterized protein LOC126800669 n=1 Tax=Argentina anserina TaxID=57926 RepID=UPI0021764973|nr:uncharacterized protein LOC126800669 [Potentilla anserina]